MEPTTPSPEALRFPVSTDYHWDQFNKNVTAAGIEGNWKPGWGTSNGPLGFGKAIYLEDYQCMYDETWMKPDVANELDNDPCMLNPRNCTEGFSWSIFENMVFGADIVGPTGGQKKKYVMSTGGDYNPKNGKAWPGFALYHQGLDLVAVVSTGDKVWELRVAGQLYNNTWVNIGIRWRLPDLSKPSLAETPEGREKMGGLEMFIGGVGTGGITVVGQTILPELTDKGSTVWEPQEALLVEGQPVMMLGCHQNSLMFSKGQGFTGYAGTKEAPAQFDELAIWRRRMENYELQFFLGGYESDLDNINAGQAKAMIGGADLSDPGQVAAAQEALAAMMGKKATTLPPFPTRTAIPSTTTTIPEYLKENTTTMPVTTTTEAVKSEEDLRKNMLTLQATYSNMLNADKVNEGENPKSVEGFLRSAKDAAVLLSSTDDNIRKWDAVHKDAKQPGAMKTVKEIEEYLLAWISAVNTSAYDLHIPNWKTAYFDSTDQTMRYAASEDDFVANVDKLPMEMIRSDGQVRLQYPDYSGWEWNDAKAKWDDVRENFTVPTGMYLNVAGCSDNPMTILTAVYNGLPALTAKRRNPVNIKSKAFFIDSKVISVRTKLSAEPMSGDVEETYQCEVDTDYMESNPVRLMFYHKKPQKAKRSLLWHKDDYWEGLEVRHCVHWDEKFGFNGAWNDVKCKVLNTDDEKTECECGALGSYAVLAEMLTPPNSADISLAVMVIKWLGIITGTVLLTIFAAVVFLSVVVGEMFHQIRMYTCISYMLANIIFLLGDTDLCNDRHNNMALSMAMMFFYQAAIWWNMCEAHATFKGITSGLINGRTSVYHPICWGGPLICIGGLCFMYGELLGTHPQCFISWENVAVEKFFYYNSLTFLLTFYFELVIVFNVVRVQSHNKETVMYLKDQVKGLLATSVLMMTLWCWKCLGWLTYYKDDTLDMPNPTPLFHIFNGWFGVILFLTLGIWSKRFMIGLRSQAEEKKNKLNKKKQEEALQEDEAPLGSPEDGASPSTSSPTSPAGSRAASAAPGSRPATAGPSSSRPGSAPALEEEEEGPGVHPEDAEAAPEEAGDPAEAEADQPEPEEDIPAEV